ncbi:hypothetical protein N9N28_02990 [Rubripirellula amarantea]|nr:hypothetical protein [Rubripirellula amarantea]
MHADTDRLPLAFCVYTAICAFVFAVFYTTYSAYSLFAIPFGGMFGYIGGHIRQRFTPRRYSFVSVPESKRLKLLVYLLLVGVSLAIWHVATSNWIGLWSVAAMGGLVLVTISSDFGYLDEHIDGPDDCGEQ